MDPSVYLNYLTLLDEIGTLLDRLCGLAKRKSEAVRADDLVALDQVLRQEQALSLAVRGMEQKRSALLKKIGLDGTTLSTLSDHYPAELRLQARQTAERLRNKYQLYQGMAEVARNTLECNLHEIEKVLDGLGGGAIPSTEPPKAMKTDFRA